MRISRFTITITIFTTVILLAANPAIHSIHYENNTGTCKDKVKIASWNIKEFSKYRAVVELKEIANILSKFDLIAIQELRDLTAIDRTLEILNDYDALISPEVGRSQKERYAFLYNTTKISFTGNASVYLETEEVKFIREPFIASFRAGEFDFTIFTIHVLYGDTVSDRYPEIKDLTEVFKEIQNTDPDEQDVILMGDFNVDPRDDIYMSLRDLGALPLFDCDSEKACRRIATMISDTHLYDNMWFQGEYVKEFSGNKEIYRFDELLFDNNDEWVEKAISDHRPIWATFDTCEDDD